MLNLTHLGSFIVVAEELNFHKAAHRLHLTQPALSRQIRLLEESLGTELLVRTRHTVTMTEAGILFLEGARKLLIGAQQLQDSVGNQAAESGTIVIGVGTGLAESICHVGVQHRKRYPKIDIVYREISSTDQIKALNQREIDMGFLRASVKPPSVVSEYLFDQPLVAIIPKTHPLSNLKRVKLAQLAKETVFLRPRKTGSGLHAKVHEMYREAGIKPHIVHTPQSPQFVGTTHVASGNGIYILPEGVIRKSHDLAVVRIDEQNSYMGVHIAWRKGEVAHHILQFADTARRLFKHSAKGSY